MLLKYFFSLALHTLSFHQITASLFDLSYHGKGEKGLLSWEVDVLFLWSSRFMPLPSFSGLCPGGQTFVDCIKHSCMPSDFRQVSANGRNQQDMRAQEERKVKVFIPLSSSLHGLRLARAPFVYRAYSSCWTILSTALGLPEFGEWLPCLCPFSPRLGFSQFLLLVCFIISSLLLLLTLPTLLQITILIKLSSATLFEGAICSLLHH